MAADHDYTVGGNAKMAWYEQKAGYILTRKVDIAALLVLDAGTDLASASKITSAETISVLDIPDNTWVAQVVCRIITPSTDSGVTINVGDADATANTYTYFSTFNISTGSAGDNDYSYEDTDPYSLQIASGKLYSAADQIDVLFNADATNGVFLVMALCFDFSNVDG